MFLSEEIHRLKERELAEKFIFFLARGGLNPISFLAWLAKRRNRIQEFKMKLTLQRSFGYPIPNLKLGETAEEDHFRKDRPHNVIFSTRISHKKTYRETVSFLNVSPFDTLLFFLLFSTISNHTGRVHRSGALLFGKEESTNAL